MKRVTLVRLAAVAFALAGLWIALTQQAPPQDLTLEKVTDDLHVIVGSGGNVAVLTTPDGVILVDDKFERNVPQILAKVKTLSDKPIRYVLNTHHHGDHTGGNPRLIENAEILAHRNARANMLKNSQPGAPRITFNDETSVHLGGKEVLARHLGRGHTNGDAVILFPAHRVLHTGDLFVAGAPLIDYGNGGSGLAWIQTLDAILKLDFDTVIPGHGPLMKREDIARWKKSFETARDRLGELRRQGKTREEAAILFKVEELPGWRSTQAWTNRSYAGFWEEIGR